MLTYMLSRLKQETPLPRCKFYCKRTLLMLT